MRTIRTLIANLLLISAAASFSVLTARADTYSWTNLQSDIAGVATHVDPNLVNPWGMAVSSGGTIWVSDNGTGFSPTSPASPHTSIEIWSIPGAWPSPPTARFG